MMHKIKSLVPQSAKNIYHLAQAMMANVWFGFPTRKLRVIGVTGTDGKTTTVQMITGILEQAGKKVAMASTINFRINGAEEKNLSHYTTHSAFAVQRFAARAVRENCEYLVLETSSHALDQHRVWGVKYDVALITNVTREHLDYHETIEKYRKAKKRLFEIVAKNKGKIVVNLDMENPEEFLNFNIGSKYGYMTGNQSLVTSNQQIEVIKAENIKLGINESEFTIHDSSFKLHVPALFNIENALGASCVALGEGIEMETIKEALAKIKGVPGRMEGVANDRGLNIIVDFALTPESLKKLYSFLVGVKKSESKIIAVFGSCGDRDRGKRPIMAEVVSEHADFVIITNDEPYHEDPRKIIEEIAVGIKNKTEGENFWKISDRRDAINKALEIAKPGDIIAVTGMGAEESMVIGGKKIPWNDQKVIEEELQKISNPSN
ncbi:MAG: hypothetical protein ACD_56C00150G0014 [uncultured bacterium]|nr:MAG: hypothetical protein ACD_56C00150G0014 [uncultured bacterium]